jgi:DNA-binding transcriptional regulator YhcF (GntR family)
MDRKATNRRNLVMAALSSQPETVTTEPILAIRRREQTEQRHQQIIEALVDGKETYSEIGRRLGVSRRVVSKVYNKVKAPKPLESERDPGVLAAEGRLEEVERHAKQMRLLALSELYEAKARECLREAKALDD